MEIGFTKLLYKFYLFPYLLGYSHQITFALNHYTVSLAIESMIIETIFSSLFLEKEFLKDIDFVLFILYFHSFNAQYLTYIKYLINICH